MRRKKRALKGCGGDRFIPCRSDREVHPYRRDYLATQQSEDVDILAQSPFEDLRVEYRKRVAGALNIESGERVFQFNPQRLISSRSNQSRVFILGSDSWPVKRRPSSFLIKTLERVLDLPDFPADFYMNMLDWGSSECIAVALQQSVYFWDAVASSRKIFARFEVGYGSAVRWNQKGDYLSVGTTQSEVCIWNVVNAKLCTKRCCGVYLERPFCSVNTIEWLPDNSAVVSGCSRGMICVIRLDRYEVVEITRVYAHEGKIALIRVSVDGKFLASTGEDGYVRVWKWPDMDAGLQINVHMPCRALAWHPWQPSYLAVGGAKVSLWNVARRTMVTTHHPQCTSTVISLEFSKLTGELVASVWIYHADSDKDYGQILVLASLHRVVEWIGIEMNVERKTYHLLWSGDGTKLATVGANQQMIIWKFLGDNDKNMSNLRNVQKKSSLDITNSLNYGLCIR